MLLFKKWLWSFLAFCMVPLFCQPVIAADNAEKKEKEYSEEPWETAALYLGAFITAMDSSFSFGASGVSGKIDGEDALQLDETPMAFRVDAFWRITRRNRVDFMYYDLSRDASGFAGANIPDGSGGTLPIGTNIDTKDDFRLYKLSYGFSFLKNEHVDLAAGLSLYVVDVDFQLNAEGFGEIANEQITVPVPALSLKGSFAIAPKWMINQRLDLFYLEVDKYEGKILDLGVNLDYNFWEYCGVGMGADLVYLAYAEDKVGEDFLVEVEQFYIGLLFYAKFYF